MGGREVGPQGADEAWSVSALTRDLRRVLEAAHGRALVFGEVSNFGVHRVSGHAYFTLKDSEAQLKCVMWRDQVIRLRFAPRDGQELVARGKVTVYERSGQMQLVAESLELRGQGALLQRYQELAERLRAEGLTSPERKRRLPVLPRAIGVVTSRDGAALRDVVRTILRRDPKAHVALSATPVQGAGAAPEIADALARLDATRAVDVILLVRGGGSAEDLWAFNEEPVARAIASASVPVVTGIGHETDHTIADLVADLAASTPTAAAEHATPIRAELLRKIALLADRAELAAKATLDAERGSLASATRALRAPTAIIERHAQRLDELTFRAEQFARRGIETRRRAIADLDARVAAREPRTRLSQHRGRLERATEALEPALEARLTRELHELRELEHRLQGARPDLEPLRAHVEALELRLVSAVRESTARRRHELAIQAASLDALSPLAVLGRGYALASHEGKLLRSSADVEVEDVIDVRLAHGRVAARVTEKDPAREP